MDFDSSGGWIWWPARGRGQYMVLNRAAEFAPPQWAAVDDFGVLVPTTAGVFE